MLLKTLIVDDEPVARQVLREELDQIDAVKVIGEAEDGPAAVDAICELVPDLVFLDLQMPGMSGFDVIRNIRSGERIPVIVIVTAYDKHAIEAFRCRGHRLSSEACRPRAA
jgi:two-component system LytT family response regulator